MSRPYIPWTAGELSRLRRFYPIMPRERLAREFHPHSIGSIIRMASAMKVRKKRCWRAIVSAYTPVIFAGRMT
jgi:hypothetical protein